MLAASSAGFVSLIVEVRTTRNAVIFLATGSLLYLALKIANALVGADPTEWVRIAHKAGLALVGRFRGVATAVLDKPNRPKGICLGSGGAMSKHRASFNADRNLQRLRQSEGMTGKIERTHWQLHSLPTHGSRPSQPHL